jgi:SH3-like domain-containing protein
MGWREFRSGCVVSLAQSASGDSRMRRWPAPIAAIGIATSLVVGLALGPVQGASAADMRSVSERAAVLYDAPSTRAKKLYVVAQYYPLEVVVNIDSWVKVRDVSGELAWVEKKSLSDRRTLIVSVAVADVRQSADEKSPLSFQAREGVVLELAEAPAAGWVKVRHRDGQVGYIAARQVWGL